MLQTLNPKVNIKRGDTFLLACTYDFDGDTDITNVGIRCFIYHRITKVVECTVTKTDLLNGEYEISAPDTQAWPLGTLTTDIEYTINGQVISTNTFSVVCLQDETR